MYAVALKLPSLNAKQKSLHGADWTGSLINIVALLDKAAHFQFKSLSN